MLPRSWRRLPRSGGREQASDDPRLQRESGDRSSFVGHPGRRCLGRGERAHGEATGHSRKFCIRPALQGGRPVNALCLGPPGTGKTTAIFKLFEEIESHSSRIIPVHVNCQMDSTRYSVFYQIYKKIFEHAPPSSGISFKRLFEKVAQESAEQEEVLVVALDDINYLFHEKEVDHVLYSLLRAHETCPGARMAVIGIMSELSLNYVLDPRVISVFRPEEIAFPPYTRAEISDILARRTQMGFYPGVMAEEVLDLGPAGKSAQVLQIPGRRADSDEIEGNGACGREHGDAEHRLAGSSFQAERIERDDDQDPACGHDRHDDEQHGPGFHAPTSVIELSPLRDSRGSGSGKEAPSEFSDAMSRIATAMRRSGRPADAPPPTLLYGRILFYL